jgi:two-component system, NtrC family, response regulator HydG
MPPEPVRIGLVEDDPVMGGSIVQRIELEGGTISWWKSGRQAIEAIAATSGSLDIVICDIACRT